MSGVDLGDETFVRADQLPALADEPGTHAAPAAQVVVFDVADRLGSQVALAPIQEGSEQRQQVDAGGGQDVFRTGPAAG